nr:transmembrane protein 131 isoform X2 [Halyomorpha halys]
MERIFYFSKSVFVIFSFLILSSFSIDSVENEYFSTEDDSQFITSSIPVSFHKEFTEAARRISIDESLFSSRILLKFLPPVLDFKERYLGIPHQEKVTIVNLSCNRSVLMSSISGNTVHFHSSFFQDKIIPPLGNTSFDVVFLGREEGELKSHLFIHTSEGSFKYQVLGEIISSPYRLRPFSGVKLPLNASYSPEILMHNPFETSLQLMEVYSSGNEFQLELPSGDLGGPKHIWQIPAFLTKPIIRLKFDATSQRNHSAYIRLKVDKGDVLIVPVDVEVGASCGLYAPDDLIDFGIGGTKDPPKIIKLYLRNSWKKPITVQSIVDSLSLNALKIEFQPVVVPPNYKNPTEVGILSFDWKSVHSTGLISGKIIVKSNYSGQKLIISYKAHVLNGGLEYNCSQAKFKLDEREKQVRPISIKNNFEVPIAITNVSLHHSAAPYFEIINFNLTVIMPGATKDIGLVSLQEEVFISQIKIDSALEVSTNASTITIPLVTYNGKLKKVITWNLNATYINLGTVGIGSTKQFNFGLLNENPVGVNIRNVYVNISQAVIGIVNIEKGNVSEALLAVVSEYENIPMKDVYLETGYYCIVTVKFPGGQDIGEVFGQITITTEFETIELSVKFKVDYGSLEIITDPVKFNNCFPSAICSAELIVESRFTVGMAVTGLMSIPEHSRLGFLPASSTHILPFTRTFLGYVTWNMTGNDYLSFIANSSGVHKWLDTLELPIYTREWDISLLVTHYENYLKMSSELVKLVLWLDTTEVRNLSFKALIKPSWPSLSSVPSKVIEFPLTQVGNMSYKDLMILNPSSKQPLVVQLVLEPSYPLSAGLINDFPSSNNLTVLEVVKLMGSGAYAQFKFGNRRPGSGTPLMFELSEKYLQICERETDEKDVLPNLTVKRSFVARNTGALPLTIIDFTISGHSCRAFGFRVINCQPFILLPNSSRKIDIAFTPDFTLSRITHTLTVLTLDAAVNYTLTATLPPYMLSLCSSVIKRPSWEPLVYYSSVSFMLFLLICVLAASFFESNRILRNTIITLSRESNVQPVLDLRMIGSDVSGTEQTSLQTESQCKIIWTSNAYRDDQINKEIQKPISESIFTINCSNKCQILNNGINCKKKAERTICKRFSDGSENYIEKTCWETSFSRSNSSQLVKPLKTSICITTEPYIPLANIKTRDSSIQKHKFDSNTKLEESRFIDLQPSKSKKKSHSLHSYDITKKKSVDLIPMRNIFEESESSTTSESTSSDGEKDVESMFFQSVRHHLQSKVARSRHLKLSSSSPLTKRKKPLEKSVGNLIVNEWDIEEEDTTDKATVVRNSRRSTPTVKQLKKQTVNYGKLRYDQSQSRGKQNVGERSMKSSLRKDKAQSAKKRNERFEKRVASVKATTLMVAQDCSVPPPPVWTASFSDVVAGTDISYSSVVATKHSASSQKHGVSSCSRDAGTSSSSTKNFTNEWKTEYQDAVEQMQQESSSNEHTPAPVESKAPFNSIWGNWSSISESASAQSNVHSSANSLFTDSSSQVAYEPIWTDQSLLKVLHGQQEVERKQSIQDGIRNEISWPVITSLWEPLYTPSSAVDTPPPVWGSDVWGPPITPPPNPPHTEEVNQTNLEYDPFKSLSNIWSQHSPNIWKPPASE